MVLHADEFQGIQQENEKRWSGSDEGTDGQKEGCGAMLLLNLEEMRGGESEVSTGHFF